MRFLVLYTKEKYIIMLLIKNLFNKKIYFKYNWNLQVKADVLIYKNYDDLYRTRCLNIFKIHKHYELLLSPKIWLLFDMKTQP